MLVVWDVETTIRCGYGVGYKPGKRVWAGLMV